MRHYRHQRQDHHRQLLADILRARRGSCPSTTVPEPISSRAPPPPWPRRLLGRGPAGRGDIGLFAGGRGRPRRRRCGACSSPPGGGGDQPLPRPASTATARRRSLACQMNPGLQGAFGRHPASSATPTIPWWPPWGRASSWTSSLLRHRGSRSQDAEPLQHASRPASHCRACTANRCVSAKICTSGTWATTVCEARGLARPLYRYLPPACSGCQRHRGGPRPACRGMGRALHAWRCASPACTTRLRNVLAAGPQRIPRPRAGRRRPARASRNIPPPSRGERNGSTA